MLLNCFVCASIRFCIFFCVLLILVSAVIRFSVMSGATSFKPSLAISSDGHMLLNTSKRLESVHKRELLQTISEWLL